MILRRLHHGRLERAEVERLLAEATSGSFTYDHVGSTLDPAGWPDRRASSYSKLLGTGQGVFDLAAARLRAWAPQRHLGAVVLPERVRIEPGVTVLVALRLGVAALVVPDRIVGVIDEPDRYAWSYGSLPGHAEVGEEGFEVAIDGTGSVTATISLDARPAPGLPTVAGPFTWTFQRVALWRYLDSLAP